VRSLQYLGKCLYGLEMFGFSYLILTSRSDFRTADPDPHNVLYLPVQYMAPGPSPEEEVTMCIEKHFFSSYIASTTTSGEREHAEEAAGELGELQGHHDEEEDSEGQGQA
jgi:hypothetical protein